jgi:hypothetical protein
VVAEAATPAEAKTTTGDTRRKRIDTIPNGGPAKAGPLLVCAGREGDTSSRSQDSDNVRFGTQ